MEFKTSSGLIIATGFVRLVIGERGPYIEFAKEHLIPANLYMPDNQKWRINSARKGYAYYLEYRTRDASYVKIYYQRKLVNYADYRQGMFYISPNDLTV